MWSLSVSVETIRWSIAVRVGRIGWHVRGRVRGNAVRSGVWWGVWCGVRGDVRGGVGRGVWCGVRRYVRCSVRWSVRRPDERSVQVAFASVVGDGLGGLDFFGCGEGEAHDHCEQSERNLKHKRHVSLGQSTQSNPSREFKMMV